MADSVYKNFTDQMYEIFQSFMSSGFTEEQALELTKSQYSFGFVIQTVENDRYEKLREARKKKNLTRSVSDGDATCQE